MIYRTSETHVLSTVDFAAPVYDILTGLKLSQDDMNDRINNPLLPVDCVRIRDRLPDNVILWEDALLAHMIKELSAQRSVPDGYHNTDRT